MSKMQPGHFDFKQSGVYERGAVLGEGEILFFFLIFVSEKYKIFDEQMHDRLNPIRLKDIMQVLETIDILRTQIFISCVLNYLCYPLDHNFGNSCHRVMTRLSINFNFNIYQQKHIFYLEF